MISPHSSHLIQRPSRRARLSCAGNFGAGTLWYQAIATLVLIHLLVVHAEEGLQRLEDAVLLLADARLLLIGVEALAHRRQLAPAPRHHAGEALRDLRALLEDALEGLLVEPVALHLGGRDHRSRARLSRHHAHLAEDVRRG